MHHEHEIQIGPIDEPLANRRVDRLFQSPWGHNGSEVQNRPSDAGNREPIDLGEIHQMVLRRPVNLDSRKNNTTAVANRDLDESLGKPVDSPDRCSGAMAHNAGSRESCATRGGPPGPFVRRRPKDLRVRPNDPTIAHQRRQLTLCHAQAQCLGPGKDAMMRRHVFIECMHANPLFTSNGGSWRVL